MPSEELGCPQNDPEYAIGYSEGYARMPLDDPLNGSGRMDPTTPNPPQRRSRRFTDPYPQWLQKPVYNRDAPGAKYPIGDPPQ